MSPLCDASRAMVSFIVDQRFTEATVNDSEMAFVARALAHPARIRIVRLLSEQTQCRGAELFSDLPLAQSTVSEHLRVLKTAGLVESHPVGTAMVYCLVRGVLEELGGALGEMVASAPTCRPQDADR